MDAFLLASTTGEVFFERSYRGLETFESSLQIVKATCRSGGPVACHQGKLVCWITRQDVKLIGVMAHDTLRPWLFDILHTVAENLSFYFGEDVSAETLRRDRVTVMMLLEEMLDFGVPGVMDANALLMLVPPKSFLSRAMDLLSPGRVMTDLFQCIGSVSPSSVVGNAQLSAASPGDGMGTGSGMGLGSGLLGSGSSIWWRRGNTAYLSDEVYVDVRETLDCVVDAAGRVVSSSVAGRLDVRSSVSSVPKCQLILSNPEVLCSDLNATLSFHPSVDLTRWKTDRSLVFVPPDRYFTLCTYAIFPKRAPTSPPLTVRANFTYPSTPKVGGDTTLHNRFGKFELSMVPVTSFTTIAETTRSNDPITLESVRLVVHLPKSIQSVTLSDTTHGTAKFASATRTLTWSISRVPLSSETRELRCVGTVELLSSMVEEGTCVRPRDSRCVASLHFWIPNWTLSTLAVDSLEISGAGSSAFKGVRRATASGTIQIRL